eukprot:1155865-Pelagomonas_calceolata.AAC.2
MRCKSLLATACQVAALAGMVNHKKEKQKGAVQGSPPPVEHVQHVFQPCISCPPLEVDKSIIAGFEAVGQELPHEGQHCVGLPKAISKK